MKTARRAPAAPVYREEVAGVISLQLYSPRACRAIIEQSKAAEWAAAGVFDKDDVEDNASVLPSYRSARTLDFDDRTTAGRDFERKLERLVKPLVNRVWGTNLKEHQATHLVLYGPGDFYVAHVDAIPGDDYRYFTVLCYLNDGFEGGQTSFPLLNHSVSPRAGMAILFPATYLHRAEPVTNGEKYVAVTWLCGPPPVRWF